jgi:pyridoxal phosphate enzyme (YggS family)
MPTIAENIKLIKNRIEQAAKRAGRDPADIKLVAATKDVPADLIEEAVQAGITDIGENRVQEAEQKFDALKAVPVTWHMIGHLQTNKVKQAVEIFSVIQSVDSERLADEISGRARKRIDVMIEVNTSGEAAKFGISPDKAVQLARYIAGLKDLRLIGLMTVGPLTSDGSAARKSFRMLAGLFDQIKGLNLPAVELKYLSMGMSQDFETAIEEGSNLVRVGRAIFGIEHRKAS